MHPRLAQPKQAYYLAWNERNEIASDAKGYTAFSGAEAAMQHARTLWEKLGNPKLQTILVRNRDSIVFKYEVEAKLVVDFSASMMP